MSTPRIAADELAVHQKTAERLSLEVLGGVRALKGFDTKDWGYVASMAHVYELLAEAARVLRELSA